MRKKTVKIAGQLVTVSEMKVGELKALASKYVGDYEIYRKQQMKAMRQAIQQATDEQTSDFIHEERLLSPGVRTRLPHFTGRAPVPPALFCWIKYRKPGCFAAPFNPVSFRQKG